jgi:CheY-like chemotaxis protein
MFRLRFEQKGVQLKFEISANTPQVVMSDPGKIRQVLINLIGNALKFTENGFVAVRVDWADTAQAGRLLIDVEDSGCGISAEMLDAVFDPFVQAGQDEAKQKGTGLGLALVRNFVTMLGGEITLESVLGQGTTFHITLPAKEALFTGDENDGISAPLLAAIHDGRAVKALVVEDNADNLLLLHQTLEQAGFAVIGAVNGAEGVKFYEEFCPEIIFMDMRMPVMDGYEATRLIRSTPGGESVIIIAVTASALSNEYDIIIKAGCDEVITKPFRRDVLLQVASRLLSARSSSE